VKVSHYSADRNVTYTAEGHVDCLVTGPRTATLTAVITKVGPGGPPWMGKRLGFSVYDGGGDKGHYRDRVGFSWEMVNLLPGGTGAPSEAEVGTCMLRPRTLPSSKAATPSGTPTFRRSRSAEADVPAPGETRESLRPVRAMPKSPGAVRVPAPYTQPPAGGAAGVRPGRGLPRSARLPGRSPATWRACYRWAAKKSSRISVNRTGCSSAG